MSARIGVVGAGAFGTALAIVAHRAGREVVLWGRSATEAHAMRARRVNERHLPGVELAAAIEVTADAAMLNRADILLLAVPAQATRETVALLAAEGVWKIPVVACAKGIERASGKLQSDIIAEMLPSARPAALSGPGFAEEIARGQPTAVTIAAADLDVAHAVSRALASETFRPYASDDLVGVELGGAIKNVLAIAAGVVAGRGLGESARAALIARGLAEMTRLGVALGARADTFMGLSGLGDLVLTATSRSSRNLAFGMALGEGRSAEELLAPGMPLVEGAHTARVAAELAARLKVEAPIIAAVAATIDGTRTVEQAIEGLVNRPLKAENA
jgi:glycerol-3-phosphate dehydrogenase (NAD(P)+)